MKEFYRKHRFPILLGFHLGGIAYFGMKVYTSGISAGYW